MKKKMYEAPNLQLFMGLGKCVLLSSETPLSGDDTFIQDNTIL